MTNPVPTAPPTDVRRLETPGAATLAELFSILDDLQMVLRCCEQLVEQLEGDDAKPDDLLVEALWTTALLSYARCFAPSQAGTTEGSTPTTLTEEDLTRSGLGGDVLKWHKVLLQLRDYYADRTDNPRERFTVGVAQHPDGSASGIAVSSARQPPVDAFTVRQTGAISFALSSQVNDQITAAQEHVLDEAKQLDKASLGLLALVEVTTSDR